MPDFKEATAAFQARHGAEWYLLINSPLWRAARALTAEFSPSRKLPTVATPQDIMQYGVVFAANDQGYFDALQTLEALGSPAGKAMDPTFTPDYSDENLAPNPAPAPEAPPPADPSRTRKQFPKTQPKKR